MSVCVAVVGSNGRVGAAVSSHLAEMFDVRWIVRQEDEDAELLVERALDGADIVVNAAGVAHIERPTKLDLERLLIGNVDLPLTIGRAALDRGAHFVHISSVKATGESDSSPYAASKWDADVRLEQELGDRFAHAGLSLTIMRPLALLFPPFDAGKISRLGFLRWWPSALTPPVKLPVLAPKAFLAAVESSVRAALDHETHAGFSRRDFAKSDRGNLRDVRAAMLACAHMGGSE